ncbi:MULTISPECIES: hypothetical protein [unclassified Streptomyces]|uniref:hypothetical protein n=1 Tax=unclassified Streptomyces TaxID=2593676 RepID=UPI00166053D7|nr:MULTISPECIES: hypothetical protein [unclassified Streptomyces]MBD0708190.1 hypothetical protein [Streptomyces sp. CBMA291]MBD0714500.1 hypothetical protein [Streptomyces sp. CBMA370]
MPSSLPVDPDEGFPQSFRLRFGDHVYRIELYVNAAEEILLDGALLDLLADGPFLVVAVGREEPGGLVPLLRRKAVRGLPCPAGGLSLVFREAVVAVRNLNGAGSHGSRVRAEVLAA